ncbi:uncharacterized protein LOC129717258 [Wyeomyia smithii]|uniref:uncharacterized protein LOC129717258 n=1 Tax=Wyeomyia smithii TaxID=174621 RepID=UPI002467BE0B|nr:uncharacterized protein LOC129717258 [Wyeomyia smithii]
MDPGIKIDESMCPTTPEEIEEMKNVPFRGCWIITVRPDIAFAVNLVSQFSANPGKRHWEAVKRIMRYLRGTCCARLSYTRDNDSQLTGYTDADWGGDADTRKSTTGYLFKKMGEAFSWRVKRQSCGALSSCEAEFIALSRTTQKALWWKQLLQQINDEQFIPNYCDNQSAK